MISIIVAVARNDVIGKDNKLIWHLPEDLKRFKKLTTGHTIIMGRKTFESLGRVLPNRKHIVISHNQKLDINNENVEILTNFALLKKYIESPEECFVIGGAQIYQMMLPFANKMYITRINEDFDGNVFFPKYDEKLWIEISREKGLKDEKNPFNYEFVTYVRK